MKNADMPAGAIPSTDGNECYFGLTKREIFAMAVMKCLLSRTGGPDIAGHAVDYADALLKELE